MKTKRMIVSAVGLALVATVVFLPTFSNESEAATPRMRTYYVGLLKRGPEWTAEQSAEVVNVSQAHRSRIDELIASRKMVLAGPFFSEAAQGEGALAGLFLYDVPTREEAIELANSDPAVVAGRFTIEIHTWYGPVGITYEARE